MDYNKMIEDRLDELADLQDQVTAAMEDVERLEDQRETYEMARGLRADMEAFKRAGFTEDQAFELVRDYLKMSFLMGGDEDEETGACCCDC